MDSLTKTELKYLRALVAQDVAIEKDHIKALEDAHYKITYEGECLSIKIGVLIKLESLL